MSADSRVDAGKALKPLAYFTLHWIIKVHHRRHSLRDTEGRWPIAGRWSATLASNTFWYSGVSGGGPPSWRQLFGGPMRSHWLLRSGYLLKSTTCAIAGVASSPAASATAHLGTGYRMGILRKISQQPRPPGIAGLAKRQCGSVMDSLGHKHAPCDLDLDGVGVRAPISSNS
jgi:hypothetical protein